LRNDRGKSTDGEELISRYRSTTPSYRPVYRFSRTCQGQAAFGGGCVSGSPGEFLWLRIFQQFTVGP